MFVEDEAVAAGGADVCAGLRRDLGPSITVDANGTGYLIANLLDPYIKNAQIYMCPSDPRSQTYDDLAALFASYGITLAAWSSEGLTYNSNFAVFEDTGISGGPVRTLTDVPYPAHTVLMHDGVLAVNPGGGLNGPVLGRHNETANAAYADGHAKVVKLRKVQDNYWISVRAAVSGGGPDLPRYFVTEPPYNSDPTPDELWGIARKDSAGNWYLWPWHASRSRSWGGTSLRARPFLLRRLTARFNGSRGRNYAAGRQIDRRGAGKHRRGARGWPARAHID